jgi:phage tail sheath protein FI
MGTKSESGERIEELPAYERQIRGVTTSTAAFVGRAPGGPVNEPLRVSTWSEFAEAFSDPERPDRGPYAEDTYLPHAVKGFFVNGGQLCTVVRLRPVGALTDGRAVDSRAERAHADALAALEAVDDVSIVCCPEISAAPAGDADLLVRLQAATIDHCERLANRMVILDTPPGLCPDEVLAWRRRSRHDSSYAALYYPWLEVADALSGGPLPVPTCGHVAGVWARTASSGGVHKAPANQVIEGISGVCGAVRRSDEEALSAAGVNCVRAVAGRGVRVLGARTLSTEPEWRYVSVRRLLIYLEQSIMLGTQWAVFEPNDECLWERVRRAVSDFLTGAWRAGMLFGVREADAFYVKCDGETNPPDVVKSGHIAIDVGVALGTPREFTVFRISQSACPA